MGPAQLGCSVRAALGRGGLLIHDHGWTHFQFNGSFSFLIQVNGFSLSVLGAQTYPSQARLPGR